MAGLFFVFNPFVASKDELEELVGKWAEGNDHRKSKYLTCLKENDIESLNGLETLANRESAWNETLKALDKKQPMLAAKMQQWRMTEKGSFVF